MLTLSGAAHYNGNDFPSDCSDYFSPFFDHLIYEPQDTHKVFKNNELKYLRPKNRSKFCCVVVRLRVGLFPQQE